MNVEELMEWVAVKLDEINSEERNAFIDEYKLDIRKSRTWDDLPAKARAFWYAQALRIIHPDLYLRVRCPHCVWWQFKDEAVGMTSCPNCNSQGYIYEEVGK